MIAVCVGIVGVAYRYCRWYDWAGGIFPRTPGVD